VPVRLHGEAAGDPLFAGLPDTIDVQATHRQSVLAAPPQATVLARSDKDACQSFRWGEHVWGVQFHPEFSTAMMRSYIHARREALGQRRHLPSRAAARGAAGAAFAAGVAPLRAPRAQARLSAWPSQASARRRPGAGCSRPPALLRAHPRILAGATALLLAVALVPRRAAAGAGGRAALAQALAVLLSLLLSRRRWRLLPRRARARAAARCALGACSRRSAIAARCAQW
jgi:hypothetical protein